MQKVSDAWKTVQEQQLTNESFIRIEYDITDSNIQNDATAIDNGHAYYSDISSILEREDNALKSYATLEQNLWILDRTRELIPDSSYNNKRYDSVTLSDQEGVFENTLQIELEFTSVHTQKIPGITIEWDELNNEYPLSFTLSAYNGSILQSSKYVDNSTANSYVDWDISNFDKIIIEINDWCLPYHRAKISKIFIGLIKVYDKKQLISYTHEITTDTIGATTPVDKIQFEIDNIDGEYDIDNPNGLYPFINKRQEIRVKYGFQLNNGSVEYITGGIFNLSEWDVPQNGLTATFIARDLLEFMQTIYPYGAYNEKGETLYNLALDVLEFANLPLNNDGSTKWSIDDSLKNITTTAPLPQVSIAQCLQYIAQAGKCVLYTDRSNIIHIEPIKTNNEDYKLSEFNMLSYPETTLQKPLQAIETNVYSYYYVIDDGYTEEERELGLDKEQLYLDRILINGTKDVFITYSQPATGCIVFVNQGTLVSSEFYTYGCRLKITGGLTPVLINVMGYPLQTANDKYNLSLNSSEGEVQTIDNPLITSQEVATDVTVWVNEWLTNRNIVTLNEWRADPRLDSTDIIEVTTPYTTQKIRMTDVKYSYTGMFTGTGEGRVISDE